MVCLGLAVLTVAIIALREPNGHVAANRSASSVGKQSSATSSSSARPSSSAATGRSSAPHRADSHSSVTAKAVPLVVLNNTMVSGLAKQAANTFESGGWTVTRYGNYQNDILSTCAYYDPSISGSRAAAKALQRQFPAIKRVEPRFAELPSGPVVVVLTPDYSQS